MKQTYFLVGLLLTGFPAANAVDFNKDALKSMQEKGHQIVTESEGGRMFKVGGDLCLDSAGPRVVVEKCRNGALTQKWSLNGQKHLAAQDGRCVDTVDGSARLQKCSGTKTQKWNHDGRKRLVNNAKQCLQYTGEASAGSNVLAVECNNSASQVWN